MEDFTRAYHFSSVILGIFVGGSLLGACLNEMPLLGMLWIPVGVLPWLPHWRAGGMMGNKRLAVCIAGILALGFILLQIMVFHDFVTNGQGEGPNGEGAPGAMIIAMVFFALVFTCPWLLTSLRGLRRWRECGEASEGESMDQL